MFSGIPPGKSGTHTARFFPSMTISSMPPYTLLVELYSIAACGQFKPNRFQNVQRPQSVGFKIHARVGHRCGDGNLTGKVQNGVGVAVLGENPVDVGFAPNIGMGERKIAGQVTQPLQIFRVAFAGQIVNANNGCPLFQKGFGGVSTNKSGNAGNNNFHIYWFSHS